MKIPVVTTLYQLQKLPLRTPWVEACTQMGHADHMLRLMGSAGKASVMFPTGLDNGTGGADLCHGDAAATLGHHSAWRDKPAATVHVSL